MYVEIIHDVVKEILQQEGTKKMPIIIELTPIFYETVIGELNTICKFNTEVPIENIGVEYITLYGRKVTLRSSDKLNSLFERKVVELTLVKNNGNNSIKLPI